MLIGLTGQTGAGKTTVAAKFAERGYYIIDGDVLAREVVEAGSPVLKELAAHFGEDILNADGSLNRGVLASRAFASTEGTAALNSITHPEILRRAQEAAERAYANGYSYVVFDAAALIESGAHKLCSHCVSVVSPAQARLERIMKRDNITREAALLRINAQKQEQYYIDNSDIIIRNAPPYSLDDEIDSAAAVIEADGGDTQGVSARFS